MIFYLKNKKGKMIASGKLDNSVPKAKRKGVFILQGSKMAVNIIKSRKWVDCPWINSAREEIINKNYCTKTNEDYYILNRDVYFTSPNKAACAMLGYITTKAWHEFINDEDNSMHEVYRMIKK